MRLSEHHGRSPNGNGGDNSSSAHVNFEGRPYYEDLFYYPMPTFGTSDNASPPTFSLAAGATSQQTLQIDSDAHFKVEKIVGQAFLTGAATPYLKNAATELSCTLQDGSTGRLLTFAPIPFDSLTGTAELPALLPIFRVFKMKATIKMSVTNFSAADTYKNITIVFWGTKLFPADRK